MDLIPHLEFFSIVTAVGALGWFGRRAFGGVLTAIKTLEEKLEGVIERQGTHSVTLGVHEHRHGETERRLAKLEDGGKAK